MSVIGILKCLMFVVVAVMLHLPAVAATPDPPTNLCIEGGNSDGTSPCPPESLGSTYSTTFDTTENPISEGGIWINGQLDGADWHNVQSIPGRAYASLLSGGGSRYNDSIAHLKTSFISFVANQYAEATVYRATGYDPAPSKHEVELLLRFEITTKDAHGYEILWGISGYLAVVRWNGALGSYTALYDSGDPGIGSPVDGDILRAEITDNMITVYKNGTEVVSVDISSKGGTVWTTGQPGMGFWPVDGAVVDNFGWKNFRAGNL